MRSDHTVKTRLQRKCCSDQTFEGFQHVPRAGDNKDGHVVVAAAQTRLHGDAQVHVLEAREVGGTRRRGILGVQGERVQVDARVRDVGVELPRLHQAVVGGLATLLANRRVEADLRRGDRILAQQARVVEPVVGVGLALALHNPDELNHGVRELETHVVEARAEREVLVLSDQRVERGNCELVALLHVEVDVAQINPRVEVADGDVVTRGAVHNRKLLIAHNDHVAELLEAHCDFGLRVKHRHCRQGLAGAGSEEERQRHVQVARLLRVVDQILTAVSLANHLGEALARLAGELLPDVEHIRIERVDNLVADDDGRLLDQELTNGVRPVRPVALLIRADTSVAAKFVARLVDAIQVVVDTALELSIAAQSLVRVGAEHGIILLRACIRAIGGGGKHATTATRRGRALLAGTDAGKNNGHIRKVDQIRCFTNVRTSIACTETHACQRVRQGFHSERRILPIALSPESHCWISIEEHANTEACTPRNFGQKTLRSSSHCTLTTRHFIFYLKKCLRHTNHAALISYTFMPFYTWIKI